jgi:hypothetical protein
MLEQIAIQPQFWILPAIGLFFLILGAFFAFSLDKFSYDGGWMIAGVFVAAIGVVLGLVWAVLLIPYDSKYHVMYKLSGTVESVTNTLDGGGDGERSLTPIVKLSGYADPIEMDNSRIVTLKGREVELVCTLEWVNQGLDITHCNIAAIK